ncbi:MAG: MarR family transcriptional regulator [Proteobacteria bacterium SG_bin9]|nr:MAG: MarR family transcriptional regulator [Proteobacteria bacterium SG_bin9]
MSAAPSAAANPLPLNDYLCFAVYSANLAFGRAYAPILQELGLTSYTQFIALVALSEGDDQSVHSLGSKLFLESNTLTPILKKLEVLGYIKRRRDPKDERVVLVSLTAEGRRVRERARASDLEAACGLGKDFAKVQKAVAKLRDNLIASTSEE